MMAGTLNLPEILQRLHRLFVAELAGKIDIRRDRVAVAAAQVAAPSQVPDHHRLDRAVCFDARALASGSTSWCMYSVRRNIEPTPSLAEPAAPSS